MVQYAADHPDPELEQAVLWSQAVDEAIADMVHGVPPFPYVRESLQKMQGKVDLMVVSATPVEALEREWGEHGIAQYMTVIAGQEMGTKKQHLQFAAKGKYAGRPYPADRRCAGRPRRRQGRRCALLPHQPGRRGPVLEAVLR